MKAHIKDTIMHTAVALFRGKGYHRVTINEICGACGITKKTLYYHFNSKEIIIFAYYQTLIKSPEELIRDLGHIRSPTDKLWHFFECYYQKTALLGVDLYKVLLHYFFHSPDITTSPFSAFHGADSALLYETVLEIIAEGQRIGEFRDDVSADILFWTMASAMMGASVGWCAHNGQLEEKEGIRRMFEIIFLPCNQ